ncbi:TetR/AcrR family transcriptional regulator [Spongiactinospora sp. TRM90649]|uniref:TetR/AcrR family transcriptional regulator n=1 Tax=Spongiactinospora sp. TRM90649 TaxID=3031114 RepID=UPI0023F89666|nr:TetR/AcrR family transcriptional regulator [Spongiactinospora sp. TRM90649]MDF5754210.1 TetR/AcrR family transcriptional regulator [Spongiactinospora sp. TRM90649]
MSSPPAESGTRSRTRRAILQAAASVLARDRTATLADIAERAQVGRSTLHRYFADRDELIKAAAADSLAAVETAHRDAALDLAAPLESVRRLINGFVEVGDRIAFLFGDTRMLQVMEEADWRPDLTLPSVIDLIRAGQERGVFDDTVSPEWLQHVIWSLAYTGWEAAESCALPRHGVAQAVLRILEKGVVTTPSEP